MLMRYSPQKGAVKAARGLLGALVPVVVGSAAAVVADPSVAQNLRGAWPAIPAAVLVAVAEFLRNYVKNK
jgi:hypothetical protein